MFLIRDATNGWYRFFHEDPRETGFQGTVEENVHLDNSPNLGEVKDGEAYPLVTDFCLGRSKQNQKQYRVFRSRNACINAGLDPLGPDWSEGIAWKPQV